jgi:excisionase family DNA binding protein
MEKQELLTPQEAADFLRWSLPTIYTYAARRKLPTVKLGRSLRFRRADLERLVKAGLRPALRPLPDLEDPGDRGNGGER